jgi:hypothetical protein
LVIVIGRGHSGTRAISETLHRSGIFMGAPLNESWDLVPAEPMYEACREFGRHPDREEPSDAFRGCVLVYLRSVLTRTGPRGWKIPESSLCYPWLTRMFPSAYFIHWLRDPRDNVLGAHLTDDLPRFGGPHFEGTELERRQRSWLYQSDLVERTPRPRHFLRMRLEDWVEDRERECSRLGEFLGCEIARIPARAQAVGRHRQNPVALLPEVAARAAAYGYRDLIEAG